MAFDNNKEKQELKILVKSIYKAVLKKYKESSSYTEEAQEVVADILDPNYEAEIDPNKIPPRRESVMNKNLSSVDRLRDFVNGKK